ncbi:F-box protein: endocytic membrane traffic, recycling ReCYcling 1 [Nowakowskiella sp. JEL0407]|nr:F-box protein: endocytic membrane traffic, recycling ReCYcling 1 [Nowakowskiella sp. JEL0407]
MSSLFGRSQFTSKSTPQPPKTISSLPPDLIVKCFSYLNVTDLPAVACASRRFKILVYNDGVYEPKLRYLGVLELTPEDAQSDSENGRGINKLSTRLRQLPGGHMLPGSLKYLETGTLWDTDGDEDSKESVEKSGGVSNQVISSSLPGTKITIGAGGLKGLQLSRNKKTIAVVGGMKKSESSVSSLSSLLAKSGRNSGRVGREMFKQIYTTLYPYYVDFRKSQQNSRIFQDFKDVVEVATILRRLRLFSQAKFLEDTDEANFSLESTIEWFESTILGNFERAYDSQQIPEMRKNAIASFQLNGGSACVLLFISKNPIFFDHTYNPSLISSKLPSLTGPAVGYALGDDFAKFMDYTLANLNKQAEIISQVFPPETDALTVFVNKVFEDSIAEYVNAIIVCSRDREGQAIFLHTLAVCVHCCSQLVSIIGEGHGVKVDSQVLKDTVASLFRPYTAKYIESEIQYAKKKFAEEIDRWNHMKRESNRLRLAAENGYFDQTKAQAHKRQVLKSFRAALFAPVQAVGSAIAQASNLNRVQPQRLVPKKKKDTLIDIDTDEETDDEEGDGELSPGTLVPEKQKSSLMDGAVEIQRYSYDQEKVNKLDNNSLGSLINLELCLTLIHADKEALGRALVITGNTDWEKIRPNVEKVYSILLRAVGQDHIKPAFTAAIEQLEKVTKDFDSTSTAVFQNIEIGNRTLNQFFELIHIADVVHQMIEVYYQEDVKCWVDESDFMSEIIVEKKTFERLLDDQVAHGLDKSIMIIINHVEALMSKEQNLMDFNPPDVGVMNISGPTRACLISIEALTKQTSSITGVTDRHTLDVFYNEIGVRFFNAILKHLKRCQISQSGAMQLIIDLNRYYEWACSVRVAAIAKLFVVLKELGNLYLADPGPELRNLVHDLQRFQGVLRQEEIYELLGSRTDWKKIQKVVEAKDCLIM